MTEEPVLLNKQQRAAVEEVCYRHAEIRGWLIHAVNARSNHIHVVVTANAAPQTVRDQLKANATRVLRGLTEPINNDKVWTRGGDTEVTDGDDNLEVVVAYVLEAQDRMEFEK